MSTIDSNKTKTIPYSLVKKYPGFEIRDYPSILYASVLKKGKMMEVGKDGFRDLAGFIFGGNVKSQNIAMTAPVTFQPSTEVEDRVEMSFTMPDGMTIENTPKPNYPQVRIKMSEPVRMAVITFSGFANNQKIEEKADQLRAMLKKNQMKWKEPCRFMAYNSPYRLFLRKNEVAFAVLDGVL